MHRHETDRALYATPLAESLFAAAAVACVYGFHLLYGALEPTGAMLMVMGWSALLVAALAIPEVRKSLAGARGLVLPGAFFLVAFGLMFLQLTPIPPGQKPIWAEVGRTSVATIDVSATIVELIKLVGLAAAFMVGAALGSTDQRARRFLGWLVYAGAAFAVGSIIVAGFNYGYHTQAGRLEARFMNPNTAGTVFGSLFLLSLALVSRGLRRAARGGGLAVVAVGGLCAGTIGVAALMTVSRGALLATVAGVMLFLITQVDWRHRPVMRLAMGGVAAAVIGGMFIGVADPRVLGRLSTLSEDMQVRALTWQVHAQAFEQQPLFGYGLGGFDIINKALLTPETFGQLWDIRSAGNVYLQWLVEGGLFGAIPMFLCIAATIGLCAFGAGRRLRMQTWLGALLGVDMVFLLHGFADFALQTPSVAAYWAVLLGLQLALAGRPPRPEEEQVE